MCETRFFLGRSRNNYSVDRQLAAAGS